METKSPSCALTGFGRQKGRVGELVLLRCRLHTVSTARKASAGGEGENWRVGEWGQFPAGSYCAVSFRGTQFILR